MGLFIVFLRFPDCLLCHDDELEGRCLAYVYYLTPDWTAEDGGTLDLFDSKPSSNQTGIKIIYMEKTWISFF